MVRWNNMTLVASRIQELPPATSLTIPYFTNLLEACLFLSA